jgi:two-component sensor histidine kinase/ligand-binding sensor protein
MVCDERQFSLLVIPVKDCSWVSVYGRDITENKRSRAVIERRIHALTQPAEDDDVTFEDLFNREEIQRIQDEFSDATGVASIITRMDGTPVTEPSNFTSLCSDIIRKTERGCLNCFRSDAAIGGYHPAGPVVQQCLSGGLWDAGASITVGNRHIANWLIGQVRDETRSDEAMLAYAREIGADEEQFIQAFHRVPAMSREQFERIATLLFSMAGQLSRAAYQNIQQARSITDQERSQEKIRHLLQEKELLLKEVHHRIKNNMSTVMSLLSLQARSMNDPALAGALGDARRRIQSMMLLYEKLYRSEGFRDLPVSAYLQALIRDILASFPNRDMVKLELDIQDFPMETRQLSAVGLIVNELLSNAMKYAFTGREGGTIRIAAAVQGERVRVEVRDDGVGIPAGFDLPSSSGFGLKLVDMLTQQIGGALRIEQDGGTAFILECTAG